MRSIGRLALLAIGVCALSVACEATQSMDLGKSGEEVVAQSSAALTVDQTLLDAFETSLRVDLLDPYYPTAHDGSYGGFVEDRSGTWALQQDGDKFLSFQARLTWTAAKASLFYASDATRAAQLRASADVGFQFLQKMWRGSTDGFGLMSDRNGNNPRNDGKESFIVYGNAFGLYAAAAYYGISGSGSALELAINAYNYLNANFWDSQYGGYNFTASDTRKDTNTNVHCLEALIEFHNDLPTSHSLRADVASRISTLLARYHDNAIHCPATNDCFAYPIMNQDWTANTADVSFGHDLELSMLMVEGIKALGQDPASSPYIAKLKKVVDFTFSHGGYRSDGGFYYTGTYNNGTISINDSQLQWWPQAEGLGALCLMGSIFPNDTTYGPLLTRTWGFINTQIIDHTNHGWVRQANDWSIAKGWEWHCNYHNGRALMNCLNWLTGSTPTPTCSDGIQNQGETGVDCGGPCPACAYNNALWLEAELGVMSGSPIFETSADGSASGGYYIQSTSNNPDSPGPSRGSYTFNAAAGTYKIWGRAITPNANSDSFWVSVDGGSFIKWNSIPVAANWAWDDVHNSDNGSAVMSYNLAQGSHTIVIANRESGAKLDKLYVTAKGDVPSGLGGGCTPTTCSALGAMCGSPSDGCGGTLSCGTCSTGLTCSASYQCLSGNAAPQVNAGVDRSVTLPSSLTINGTVSDDGLPAPPVLTIAWSQISGPGTATFSPTNTAATTATFSAAGTYVLRLTASDGLLAASDDVQITVSNGGPYPCDGLCPNPSNFTINGSYQSGNLGTGSVCRQTTSVVHGGNCGNFTGGRSLSVNGTIMTCNGGNWPSMPAARNGGYCISTTAGNYTYAYFTAW